MFRATEAEVRWSVVVTLALFGAGSMACASSIAELGALTPVATVATIGLTDDVVSAQVESPESNQLEDVEVTSDETSSSVRVDAAGADQLRVAITQVTLGEALAFLSGARQVIPPDIFSVLDRADRANGEGHFELHEILGSGTGIFTLDAVATQDGGAKRLLRTLIQISPLRVAAQLDSANHRVAISVADPEGRPMANTRVELVDATGRSLGTSATNGQGEAVLAVASDRESTIFGDDLFVVALLRQYRSLVRVGE